MLFRGRGNAFRLAHNGYRNGLHFFHRADGVAAVRYDRLRYRRNAHNLLGQIFHQTGNLRKLPARFIYAIHAFADTGLLHAHHVNGLPDIAVVLRDQISNFPGGCF